MAYRTHPNVTSKRIQELEEELKRLCEESLRLDQEAFHYVEDIVRKLGNKPVVRNAKIRQHPNYKEYESLRFFEPNPWFWEIKPDDDPKVKAMKDTLRNHFIWDCMLTPEERAEFERLLARSEPLDRRIEEIQYILHEGMTEEQAKRQVEDDEAEESEDHGGVLFA